MRSRALAARRKDTNGDDTRGPAPCRSRDLAAHGEDANGDNTRGPAPCRSRRGRAHDGLSSSHVVGMEECAMTDSGTGRGVTCIREQQTGGLINGLPSEENPYVFNGDFVDRGNNSMEILIILFAFLLVYPNHLHLNRGNHEDYLMNLRYGFTKEIMKKYKTYGKPILHFLQDVYSWLPLATIIDNQILILHDITARLLQRYNLKLLIRSHQCKQEGYEIGHNGKVITIFSASNYYEEGSNRGAYIKLNPDLIPRFVQYQVSKSTRKQTLHQRVTAIELSALKCLQEKLYTHKSDLLAAFTQYDPICTGRISLSQWASAMESVLHLDLPWRTLRSRLVCLALDGSVEYLSCFDNLEIILPIKEVQPYLAETLCRYKADLEIIFNMIDQDHSGLISADEFRQTWKLFNAHVKNDVSDESIDSLVRTMDFNKDGSIDFNEFLEAFHVVHKFRIGTISNEVGF
ncbi:serine/threonine-protein phosphatase with EF-hands 1 [Crotalus adamanteus]|uniref:Serine/threonine-protein phosphatase n=1 Tax=Crotalus adamanteus TaxID=8729 RepID=A0AAW1BJ55_CROAD